VAVYAANEALALSRLQAKRREQTPQALARLVVVLLFVGLWCLLWFAQIPMPFPFLVALLAEITFFAVFLWVVSWLPTVRAVAAAQYAMLAAEIVFHTIMVYFLGGISWLGPFAYVFGLIFTNAFLDLRRGLIYTTGACLAFSTLVLLEATGVIPHYVFGAQGPLRYKDAQFVTTALVGAVGVFYSIYLWSSWVGHQLRRERDTAVRAQDDLLAARAELQLANLALEERVSARTAELESANVLLRDSEQRLHLVLETCPDLIAIQEPSGEYRFTNSAYRAVLGYKPDELAGKTPVDLIHPDDIEHVRETFVAMLADRKPAEATFRFRHAQGHWVILEANGQVLVNRADEPTGVVVVSRDVTERRRAEEAVRASEEILKSTIESTADGILVVSHSGQVAYANARFAEMWRMPNELLETRDREKMLAFAVEQLQQPELFLSKVQELYQTDREDLDTLYFKDGRVFERYSRSLMLDGATAGRVWSFRDITERKRAEEALHEQARRDPLTGLLNRRAGLAAVDELVVLAKQTSGRLAVLVLDLDRFKLINDRFSHETGDAALCHFSELMRKLVSDTGVVCRLGGDEFQIALNSLHPEEALAFADRLRASLRRSLQRKGSARLPQFTVSVGIACYPGDAETSADLGHFADEAMYAGKASGGDASRAWRDLGASRAA